MDRSNKGQSVGLGFMVSSILQSTPLTGVFFKNNGCLAQTREIPTCLPNVVR